jgi:hypothetical protein
MPIDRNEIECWRCTHEMAADARYWLSVCSDLDLEQQLSPMGRPATASPQQARLYAGERAPVPDTIRV